MKHDTREMLIQCKLERNKILKLNSILGLLGMTKRDLIERSIDNFIDEYTKNPTPKSRWMNHIGV